MLRICLKYSLRKAQGLESPPPLWGRVGVGVLGSLTPTLTLPHKGGGDFIALARLLMAFDKLAAVAVQRFAHLGHAAGIDFVALHADRARRFDADAHAIAADGDHGDANFTGDDDFFTDTTRKY